MSNKDPLPPDLRARVNQMYAEGKIVERPDSNLSIKWPPAPYSRDWYDALTPEQKEELRASLACSAARFSRWMQDSVPLLQAVAQALQNLTHVVGPFVEALQALEESDLPCRFWLTYGYCHCNCEDIPGAIGSSLPVGRGRECGVCVGA